MTLSLEKQDQLYGWLGAILLHILAAIVLALWYIHPPPVLPDVVEVDFIAAPTPPPAPVIAKSPSLRPAIAKSATAKAGPAVKSKKGKALPAERTRRVKLPERSSVTRDEVLAVPKARKLDVPETAGGSRRATSAGSARKDERAGSTKGTRSGQLAAGTATGKGTGAGKGGPGIADRDAGSSALGSVQWIGGGRRRKITGNLPAYPSGTNVEAQIRVEAVVTPAGTVKSVRPAQKGNARLEEVAMRELKQWRFEPLSRNLPQKDQHCIVTFNFALR